MYECMPRGLASIQSASTHLDHREGVRLQLQLGWSDLAQQHLGTVVGDREEARVCEGEGEGEGGGEGVRVRVWVWVRARG